MIDMRTCIYRLEQFGTSHFTRDHVLPEALGKFEQNLTLTDCVCTVCNQFLGNSIELFLSRDSLEAIRRLEQGLKPVQEVTDLLNDRLQIIVVEEGPLQGARLKMQAENGHLVVMPVPQVGFLNEGKPGRTYVSLEELEESGTSIPDGVNRKNGILIVAATLEVRDRLILLLQRNGIQWTETDEVRPPDTQGNGVLIEMTYRMDLVIQRAIAKIAFNYMANRAGVDFALHSDFNAIRSFIRHGTPPAHPIVLPSQAPILFDDRPHLRQTKGHLITVFWAHARDLIAQVSLFNEITYTVRLVGRFTGIWRPIAYGHHFDIETRKAEPLRAFSDKLVPRMR